MGSDGQTWPAATRFGCTLKTKKKFATGQHCAYQCWRSINCPLPRATTPRDVNALCRSQCSLTTPYPPTTPRPCHTLPHTPEPCTTIPHATHFGQAHHIVDLLPFVLPIAVPHPVALIVAPNCRHVVQPHCRALSLVTRPTTPRLIMPLMLVVAKPGLAWPEIGHR